MCRVSGYVIYLPKIEIFLITYSESQTLPHRDVPQTHTCRYSTGISDSLVCTFFSFFILFFLLLEMPCKVRLTR